MAGVTISTVDGGFIQALPVNMGTAAANVLVAALAANRNRVYKLVVVSAAAQTVQFQDGATNLTGPIPLTTGVPLVLPMDGQPWLTSSIGNALNITQSSAVNLSGGVWFSQNPL